MSTFIMPKDKFEEAGCRRMEAAKTFQQGKEWYDDSCSLCTMWKRDQTCGADCRTCPIRATFILKAKKGEFKRMRAEDYCYIEMDEAAE